MRLVAWNANHNCRRRSLEENASLLAPLAADLLVVSETAAPRSDNPLGACWIGEAGPGLAVIPKAGVTLTPYPENESAPPLMAAFSVAGPAEFDLLAVWPVQRRAGPSYHDILMAGLDRYAAVLGSGRAMMVGDLNTSSRVRVQARTHPVFVRRAEELGLVSAYHALTGEAHGEETVATYLHRSAAADGFHIDYCFVPADLKSCATLTVLADASWAERSDHFPLVLDIPDEALSRPSRGQPV